MTAGRRAAKERGNPAGHSALMPRVAANERDFTLSHLEMRRQQAADWVVTFGEWLLPLFERLDDECARRERQQSSLDRVRAMARRA